MGIFGGGGSAQFSYTNLVMAFVVLSILPLSLAVFVPATPGDYSQAIDDLNDEYRAINGSSPAHEAVWCLTGIYTPYSGGQFGYTSDGWLYGERVDEYSPSQYNDWPTQSYEVQRGDNGVYTYTRTPTGQTGIEAGDTYTSVSFDKSKISSIFFTESGKTETDSGFFYYNYDGYRYAFAPLANYKGVDQDGEAIDIAANESTLSLIWYQYTTASSGIAGNLIIGYDAGLAYITTQQIVNSFNDATSTSKFQMHFNGLDINIYIRLNPYAIAQGLTVEECYNQGLWTVLITSLSTDADAYMSANSPFSVYQILETVFAIFTFNVDDYYDLDGWIGMIVSLVYTIVFYSILLAIALDKEWMLIAAGVLAAVQAIATAITNFGLFG